MDKTNASKLVNTMRAFGFDQNSLTDALFLDKDTIVRLGNPPVRIEIMTSVSGVNFEECFKHRKQIKMDEIQVNIIGREDLLRNKKAAGRYKDLADVEKLERLP